jgi:hypothetical protein
MASVTQARVAIAGLDPARRRCDLLEQAQKIEVMMNLPGVVNRPWWA